MGKKSKIYAYLGMAALFLAGCSGSVHETSQGTVPVTLTIHDAAPTGVTVVAFAVQISGVSLQGTSSNDADIALLTSPVTVQLQNLETLNELIAKTSAPAGTYDSIKVTFSGASATILNGSAQTQTLGGQACAAGKICQFQPTLSQMSTTISSTPFPVTLTANKAVNIALDFNVGTSLQTDFSVNPKVTASVSTTPLQDGNLADISGVTGQITTVGNNQLTITDSNTGQPLTVAVGTSTQFSGFTGCANNNFTCVQPNQIATVNFGVDTTAAQTMTANQVTLNGAFTHAITGTVVATNPGQNQATVVVTGESPMIPGVAIGQEIIVTPSAGATFGVSAGGTTIPANLTFLQASDLAAGQSIMVDGSNVTAGSVPTVATAQIQLVPTQFSGTVSSANGSDVMINGLNGVFTGNGISQIQVQTGTQTQFTNVTGISGLTTGTTVSLGGFLFNTPNGVVLIGQQVNVPPAMP